MDPLEALCFFKRPTSAQRLAMVEINLECKIASAPEFSNWIRSFSKGGIGSSGIGI
jgi:hypothetical protein